MLHSFLFQVKDFRRKQGRRYELGHILLFSILAILSGADSYRQIHAFIKAHYATLDDIFGLHWKRMPAYTAIRYIIQGTSGAELETGFRDYSAALAASGSDQRYVAFDGKVLRGSFDHFRDQKAIQVLSAFLTEGAIILAHEEIAAKTNEIPTAQELMEKLGLSHCIFTLDALHCQTQTLSAAKATANEVIVQVKANQPTLLQDCIATAAQQTPLAVYQEPWTKAHQRLEKRTVRVFGPQGIRDAAKWHLVAAIVSVERHRRVFDPKLKEWNPSDETAFYISTTQLAAQEFGQAIRWHWGIENRDHYVRDVSLGEDQSRIRVNPHIFATLRSFALNILRVNKVQNVKLELFENCMNLDRVLNYVGIA